MTDRAAKLMAKLEASSKQVTVAQLETVMRAHGFTKLRQSGSHAFYRNAETRRIISVVHHKPHVKDIYVKKAIAIMKEGGDVG